MSVQYRGIWQFTFHGVHFNHYSQTPKIVDQGFTKISFPPLPPRATLFLFPFVFVTDGKDGHGLKLESKLTKLPVFHM